MMELETEEGGAVVLLQKARKEVVLDKHKQYILYGLLSQKSMFIQTQAREYAWFSFANVEGYNRLLKCESVL